MEGEDLALTKLSDQKKTKLTNADFFWGGGIKKYEGTREKDS